MLVISLFGSVSSCSVSADAGLAEKEVVGFHKLLGEGRFEEIYKLSSIERKKAVSEEDFVALLDSVHRKLGRVESSMRKTARVDYHTSGKYVTLVFETRYSEGSATESFQFRSERTSLLLASYFINSLELVTK